MTTAIEHVFDSTVQRPPYAVAHVGPGFNGSEHLLPALLLDWRSSVDQNGRQSWHALIAYARAEVLTAHKPFTLMLEWVPARSVRPLPPSLRMAEGQGA